MPVGTLADVKLLEPRDLHEIGSRIVLANAYHLWLRPGRETLAAAGGLHRFMAWDGPILTDSGGYQVFSLESRRTVDDDGVTFRSHLDGSTHRFTPENVVAFQEELGVDVAMALDECVKLPSPRADLERAVARTTLWAERCAAARRRSDRTMLFGIVQGGLDEELRARSAAELVALDLPGYAIGGLSVGETRAEMDRLARFTAARLPPGKPRYLMGVGTVRDLVAGIDRGIDLFDCVYPTRSGRHGRILTRAGAEEVGEIRFRVRRADAAVAVGVGRPEIAQVLGAAQVVLGAGARQDPAVASAAGRVDAVEQIDPAIDPRDQIADRPDAHEIARLSGRQPSGGEAREPVHLGARLADREPADRVAGKIERHQLRGTARAQLFVEPALDDPEQHRAIGAAARRGAALRPQRRARDGALEVGARRRQLHALVQRHRDVDAELFLKRDDVFGGEAVRAAVQMRAERDPVVVDRAPRLQAEHLVAAGIGQDRTVPRHEPVESAGGGERLAARPQPQMVRVREHDSRADLVQVARFEQLHVGERPDRHEARRRDLAVL